MYDESITAGKFDRSSLNRFSLCESIYNVKILMVLCTLFIHINVIPTQQKINLI